MAAFLLFSPLFTSVLIRLFSDFNFGVIPDTDRSIELWSGLCSLTPSTAQFILLHLLFLHRGQIAG